MLCSSFRGCRCLKAIHPNVRAHNTPQAQEFGKGPDGRRFFRVMPAGSAWPFREICTKSKGRAYTPASARTFREAEEPASVTSSRSRLI